LFYESLSYEEISERLDMPVASIGPTRARALDKLRLMMEGLDTTDTSANAGFLTMMQKTQTMQNFFTSPVFFSANTDSF
jgi:hypothetical protein